jgi:hypothetical protein
VCFPIWQNGVFLNGYFSGVWSNGVFKGYPRTTEMVDSHWVTGYFEGGHFKSNNILENRNEDLPEYNTGLIQSITFKDRNVAYRNFSAYESWMDVNYSTQSNVNLNTYTKVIGISQKSQKVVESYLPNLSGYPTSDILSSDSYFRNSKTPSIRRYSLGIKYQEYENFLKSQGNFNVPLLNPTNYTFPVNSDESKISQKIKSSEFFSQGWTYSLFEGFNNSTVGYVVSSNINELTSQRLKLSIESIVYNGGEVNGLIFFNLYNTKVITKPERYYVAEIILSQTYSLGGYLSDNTTNNAYQTYLHDLSKKRSAIEYFYNTPTMDFSLFYLGGKGASFSFEKISFYEVDSIPFFKYYKTDSEIDLSIKNPYIGTAPIIDYTNKNFDFVGNVELGIDYRTIVQQNSFSSNQIGRFQLAQYNPVIPSGPNSG